jgi:uncharacterized protein
MRLVDGAHLFSATDLVNFLGCAHATVLDLRQLTNPVELSDDDGHAKLLQEKGMEHERAYLSRLQNEGCAVADLSAGMALQRRIEETRKAMRAGADVIYQGALAAAPWHGYSDFLRRRDDVSSSLGSYSYEVLDTKLALTAKPKHVVQLCVYSALLAGEQGRYPDRMHIVLGNKDVVSLRVPDFQYYFELARHRFEQFAATPQPSKSEPCGHCDQCRWNDRCNEEWLAADDLTIVAKISRSQRKKLLLAGVSTTAQLASLPAENSVPKLARATLERLIAQARLQVATRADGENRYELLPAATGRGFARLPQPDHEDLFFDIEGDPLFDGGLEYLFGFVFKDGSGKPQFRAFWAHDRAEEKIALERAIDFMVDHLSRHPRAHIYHYAAYERTALGRLSMLHGTRAYEVDELFRRHKLVDLYKVVREAVRVSEPRYSIKNIERFYLDQKRAGEVTTAGDSVVMYERWRRLQDPQLLQDISDYNEIDCRSTLACRDWLLQLRPSETPWFDGKAEDEAKAEEKRRAQHEAEVQRERLAEALVAAAADDEDRPWRELCGHLLEYHRREAKPQWWALFNRRDMDEDELVDDEECLGGLIQDPARPPYPDKRSTVYCFSYPPQATKLRKGDDVLRADTLEPAGTIVDLDREQGLIQLKLGPSRPAPPETFSLVPRGPLDDSVLRDAIYRYAEAVAAGQEDRYAAVSHVLRKRLPRLSGRTPGRPIVADGAELVGAAKEALTALDSSYLLIQGPPGAGKTYTSSHSIVDLLRRGKRVGVASNSHKAINNLLAGVEEVASQQGLVFRGVKKSSNQEQFLASNGCIRDVTDNKSALDPTWQLVAGTAWFFAHADMDQALDYLFIDEAGQVSLANVVAMGTSTRNIVLVGDQMQLSQPTQGVHPGASGRSALEYLLDGHATVPPDQGVFLSITRRMHPFVCQFISEAVYDNRLKPDPDNLRQILELDGSCDEALSPAGLRFVNVEHEGCAQESVEEAERLALTYSSLLQQVWVDRAGLRRPIGMDDILVVSPYNLQVNRLQATLPAGARVGTVDKFQGQEAAAVLISMATSSADDLPRNIEFLFSRNRLNVAISRARCLAVIFANPRLLEIPCSTIEQMRLVNTLCWAKHYATGFQAADQGISYSLRSIAEA